MSDGIGSRRQVIESALLRVAENVAKHTIQRSGWSEDDECFQVDLQESVNEIERLVMPDPTPIEASVNWHTWVSGLVNSVVVAVGIAFIAYLTTHQPPPVIPTPAPTIVNVPAEPAKAPAPKLSIEDIQKAINDLKKGQ